MKIFPLSKLLIIAICSFVCYTAYSDEITITDIPYSNWHFYRDVTNNALVSIDTTRQNLYLHTFDGKMTHLQSGNNRIYMKAELCERKKLLLTGEFLSEDSYLYSLYDYDGNLLYPPIESPYILNLSKYGDFYLTGYDMGYASNYSIIFSLEGKELLKLPPIDESVWDLKDFDSTKIFFRDGGMIYIYDVSDFSLVKQIDAGVDSLMEYTTTSVVAGGRYYGFNSHNEIIIVDLESGEVAFQISKKIVNGLYKDSRIVIDDNHQRVLLLTAFKSNTEIEIYSFEKKLPKLLYDMEVLTNDIIGFSDQLSHEHKGFFVLNFYRDRNPDVYRSMIVTLMQKEDQPELLPGILLHKPDGSDELMQVSLINHTLKIMDFIHIE